MLFWLAQFPAAEGTLIAKVNAERRWHNAVPATNPWWEWRQHTECQDPLHLAPHY